MGPPVGLWKFRNAGGLENDFGGGIGTKMTVNNRENIWGGGGSGGKTLQKEGKGTRRRSYSKQKKTFLRRQTRGTWPEKIQQVGRKKQWAERRPPTGDVPHNINQKKPGTKQT